MNLSFTIILLSDSFIYISDHLQLVSFNNIMFEIISQ
jgi:hypothetical protein